MHESWNDEPYPIRAGGAMRMGPWASAAKALLAYGNGATGYGVPGGVITDPFYRNREEKRQRSGRTGGRSRHLGIDVSVSRHQGGGASDERRGLEVRAIIRPRLELARLNRMLVVQGQDDQIATGVGIPGIGHAELQDALVRQYPWRPRDDDAYGGVLGLACRYRYSKRDGSQGILTVYLEFLHLITDDHPPKDGAGNVISWADWTAAGKGARKNFGPLMVNGARLSAAQLATQPLVGYLGATEFPHVHIQCAIVDGEARYARRPRVDPDEVLVASAQVAGHALTLPDLAAVTYTVPRGQEYGRRFGATPPPGLPRTARQASNPGAAYPFVQQIAAHHVPEQGFQRVIRHLAQTESGGTFALPASNRYRPFNALPREQRGGAALITAWGVFNFNRDAWRALDGVRATDMPWSSTPFEEIQRPIRHYAAMHLDVVRHGGSELDGLRAIRLWHAGSSIGNAYVRGGKQTRDWAAAWRRVPARYRDAVDRHLRNAGVAVQGAAQALAADGGLSIPPPHASPEARLRG